MNRMMVILSILLILAILSRCCPIVAASECGRVFAC